MSTRENILNRLRQNVRETYDMPNLSFEKTTYTDPIAEFIHQTTTTAGAKLIEVKPDDDLNELIRQAYPDAHVIASNLQNIKADKNPDTVSGFLSAFMFCRLLAIT